MNTTTKAPDFPGGRPGQDSGYPSKGAKLGPAWQELWDVMGSMGEDYSDGKTMSELVAPNHDLAPSTLVALLSRAARAGVIEKVARGVQTTRGRRTRTFYRIKQS